MVQNNTPIITLVLTSTESCGGGAAGEWIFKGGTEFLSATIGNDKDSSENLLFEGFDTYVDSTGATFPSQQVPLNPGLQIQISATPIMEIQFKVTVPTGATGYVTLIR